MVTKFLIKVGLNIALALIRLGYDYMDKNDDGKISWEEFEQTAKELKALTQKIHKKSRK